MCDMCIETRNQPRDYSTRTVADAARFEYRNAMPAPRDTPTRAEALRDDWESNR